MELIDLPFEHIKPIDYDRVITGLQEAKEILTSEKAALAQALEELCELKIIKDREGKTPEYLKRQPKAWIAANQAITNS